MEQDVMRERILVLDDALAVRILSVFSRVHLRGVAFETECIPELRKVLMQKFKVAAARLERPSEGELARQSLLLLNEDPLHSETIRALVEGPAPQRFADIGTVAIITAVLVVLQTRVKFERDKDGRIHLEIEKKATSEGLLKVLVQKVVAFLGTTPSE